MTRLAELQAPPQGVAMADVAWTAAGERRPVPAGEAELWLTLSAEAPVWLTCQRCLQPFAVPLAVQQRLRFVHGEAQAEALDAEHDDDVLAVSKSLDLRELIEDELLLSLPIVPRHERCPKPLVVPADVAELPGDLPGEPAERPNPFAALLALKKPPGDSGSTG